MHCYLIILVTYFKVFILKHKTTELRIKSYSTKSTFFEFFEIGIIWSFSSLFHISISFQSIDIFFVIVFKLRPWAIWRMAKQCSILNTFWDMTWGRNSLQVEMIPIHFFFKFKFSSLKAFCTLLGTKSFIQTATLQFQLWCLLTIE